MTDTQTAPAETTAPKRGRVSAEDAVYKIVFIDSDGKEHNRVPLNVVSVKVIPAGGQPEVVNLKDFHNTTLWQSVALTARGKLQVFLKDVKKNSIDQVPGLVAEFVKSAKEATLFVPKEGGGPGRAFDYEFWIDVIAKVAELKIKAGVPNAKPMSAEAKEALRTKLQSMTPEQRKAKQEDWNKDKTFRNAVVLVRAERVETKLAKEGLNDNDEYDVLEDI